MKINIYVIFNLLYFFCYMVRYKSYCQANNNVIIVILKISFIKIHEIYDIEKFCFHISVFNLKKISGKGNYLTNIFFILLYVLVFKYFLYFVCFPSNKYVRESVAFELNNQEKILSQL